MFENVLNKILFPKYNQYTTFDHSYLIYSIPNATYNLFFFHGNAGNVSRENALMLAEIFNHCNIIQISYPGYYVRDKPWPKFDSLTFMNEIECVFYEIVNKEYIDTNLPNIIVGQSIGTVVAGSLVRRLPENYFKAAILITPISEIGPGLFPPDSLIRLSFLLFRRDEEFNNIRMLKERSLPVLLITATQDEIIDNYNSYLLERVRNNVYNISIDSGHNNVNLIELKRDILSFLHEKANLYVRN